MLNVVGLRSWSRHSYIVYRILNLQRLTVTISSYATVYRMTICLISSFSFSR